MTIPLKDVYLDGRMMGRAATWGQVADLISASGHPALGSALQRNDRVSFGESPRGFYVVSRRVPAHA